MMGDERQWNNKSHNNKAGARSSALFRFVLKVEISPEKLFLLFDNAVNCMMFNLLFYWICFPFWRFRLGREFNNARNAGHFGSRLAQGFERIDCERKKLYESASNAAAVLVISLGTNSSAGSPGKFTKYLSALIYAKLDEFEFAIKLGSHRFFISRSDIIKSSLITSKLYRVGYVHTINIFKRYQKNVPQILIFVDCGIWRGREKGRRRRRWERLLWVYSCCFEFYFFLHSSLPARSTAYSSINMFFEASAFNAILKYVRRKFARESSIEASLGINIIVASSHVERFDSQHIDHKHKRFK